MTFEEWMAWGDQVWDAGLRMYAVSFVLSVSAFDAYGPALLVLAIVLLTNLIVIHRTPSS